MEEKNKKIIVFLLTVALLFVFYMFTREIRSDALEEFGMTMSLPVFTFLIALVDGFNPCNLFVLTLLMSLMLAESHSRKRIYAVGFTFVAVVFLFYLLFMAIGLNLVMYIGFIDPLMIV